jgi:hypothetical protein
MPHLRLDNKWPAEFGELLLKNTQKEEKLKKKKKKKGKENRKLERKKLSLFTGILIIEPVFFQS